MNNQNRALWTSFLPTKIGTIRFNLATVDFSRKNGEIAVESHLTSVEPCSKMAAATITADLSIFNALGEMQIQVQDLTVSSLAAAKPEDDYELYLHTVLDLDPEDEILTSSEINMMKPDRALVESCERVARHFASQQRHCTVPENTPPASPVMKASPGGNALECPLSSTYSPTREPGMDQFIINSPYQPTLKLARLVSEKVPETVPGILPLVIQEAQQLLNFQKHVGRVIQQLAHRYPKMAILGLTDPSSGLVEHILDGLQGAYLSYTIGNGTQKNIHDRASSLKPNKKISYKILDLGVEDLGGAPNRDLYDLVVLSISTFGNKPSDCLSTLKRVRKLMKNGGFLILVDLSLNASNEQLETFSLPKHAHWLAAPDSPMLSDWAACLDASTQCGFVSRSRNADQHFPPRFSLSVRQADSESDNNTFDPRMFHLRTNLVVEHLLLVGGQTETVQGISGRLAILLSPKCKIVASAKSLDSIPSSLAATCTSIIILADLEEPVCPSMTASRLESLKLFARPGMVILWVTSHAREDPEKSASFGLTRTLKAETPGLVLQVLDLHIQDDCCTMIAKTFGQLAYCAENSIGADPRTLLWSDEPEIHVENGKRLIPRVLPYIPANERLNAYRRPIFKAVNTLDACVLLKPVSRVGDRQGRYSAEILGDADSCFDESPENHLMYVEYSSSRPVFVVGLGDMYICVGRTTGKSSFHGVALSPSLQSVVQVHHLLTHEVSTVSLDVSRLISTLAQMLSAGDLVVKTQQRNVVLVEPNVILLRCVEALGHGNLAEKSINLEVWTCEQQLSYHDARFRMTYRNPWSTAREVRSYLPLDCVVYDFLPEGIQLSKTLSAMNSIEIGYHRDFGIWTAGRATPSPNLTPSTETKSSWDEAVKLSLEELCQRPPAAQTWSVVSPAQLLDTTFHMPQNSVVDWQTNRNVQIRVKPLVKLCMLHKDKTYVLVGLTRDMGQTICRLFIEHGARNIVIASRNADASQAWVAELNSAGINMRVERFDVTVLDEVKRFHQRISSTDHGMPPVVGVVNGAMILEDRIFAQMDIDSWTKVMRPKTVGSKNLDIVFDSVDLQFFIMTSSFAAIGGHGGQSNYAAANMYMNGLAMNRRGRGLAGSVLNIGVIYGLGLLARERQDIYGGLERDGYPPISERDIHHMFIEAIEAGRPVPRQTMDLTTGLARYRVDDANPQHWHRDQRFCHYGLSDDTENEGQQSTVHNRSMKDLCKLTESVEDVAAIIQASLCRRMETILQLPIHSIKPDKSIVEMGIDSLAAVEIRNWIYKSVGRDVPVLKILGTSSISKCKLDFLTLYFPMACSC